MSAPCPSSAPPYFTITYHIIAVISAPINIFGLYLVLYKSPGISKYKYCIFYVQTAAFLTEIHMSVVSPGYYFFPLLAGYSTTQPGDGSFISTHMTMVIWLFWLGNELPAIVWSFVYRHNAAENMHRVAQHSRIVKKFALSACQVFPILVSGCFYMSDITKEQAKVYLTNNYPQCLFWLESSAFTIYDWRTNPWVAVAGLGAIIFVSIFAGYAFLLGFRTMILLHKLRSHMSPATYKMHRTALFGLTLQVILPSVLIILPLFTCFLIIYNNLIDYQGVAVNSTILISLHSLCATVVMIAANPKYRKIVEGYLNLCSVSSLPMPAPCPSTIPSWYLPTLHIIAVISFPINILGLYLVFYKSPGISKYKYCILYIQAASFLTEIQISVVSPGIYFFPLLAGISTTITEGWIIGPHTITVFWFFFLGNELPAIVWSFVYRHNAAEDMNRVTKHSRIVKKLALVASHLFPFLVCFSFYMSAITKEEARVYLLKNYPQCLFWLDSPNFTMYDWRTNPWVAVAGVGALIYVSLFASYAFSLGFRTMILLHKLRSHMSPQTYSQHKTALIGLFLQVLIPSFLIILPLFICFWVISTDQVEHQELASNSLNLICFHSVSSTIVMIAGNPRYRRTCAGYCRLRVDLRRKTTVAVEPSSTNLRRSISIR